MRLEEGQVYFCSVSGYRPSWWDVTAGGTPQQRESEAADHIASIVRKQRELNVGVHPPVSLLCHFIQSWVHTFKVDIPFSVKPSWKHPNRYTKKHVPMATLNSVKLTMIFDHHNL